MARATATYTRNLRRYVERVQAEVLQVLTHARQSGDSATALKAAAEARAIAETARKLLIRAPATKTSAKPAGDLPPEVQDRILRVMEGEHVH